MSGIAEELDAKLKTLDAKAASSLEKLVRDALELVETQNSGVGPDRLPTRLLLADCTGVRRRPV